MLAIFDKTIVSPSKSSSNVSIKLNEVLLIEIFENVAFVPLSNVVWIVFPSSLKVYVPSPKTRFSSKVPSVLNSQYSQLKQVLLLTD